ncbi:MAG: NfeD family protein [Acidimicrobiales bacterium]
MTTRRLSLILLLAGLLATLFSGLATPAAAQDGDPVDTDAGVAIVAQVSGLLDPVLADFVSDAISDAEDQGALVLVLQVNSTGAVVSPERLAELATQITDSEVPVTAWVGPSGSRATGEVAQLIGVTERIGVAPGSRIGNLGDQVLDPTEFATVWDDGGDLLRDRTIGHTEALEAGITEFPAPVLGDFLVELGNYGFEVRTIDEGDELRREPVTQVRFIRLDLFEQLLHTVASPPVAYLLFATGLSLLLFEFFTAGVGIAGVVGAGSFAFACYGLAVLPTNNWAIGVLVFSFFGFAVDVQTGVPRAWTVIGTAAFIAGTLTLYDGVSMSWIPMLVGVLGVVVGMVSGMPAMVRTRFSTPTIGREWMIGELGEAVEDVDPDGVVSVRDSLWRARTNRATPIAQGEPVRVVMIDGLWLEVEPETGAARDYRDRSRRNGS